MMDMPFRTCATRSSRPNERFGQLNPGTGGEGDSPSTTTLRKRVNVVTFHPSPSSVDEVVKGDTQSYALKPSHSTTAPTSLSTTASACKPELNTIAMVASASIPVSSPKFRRRTSHRNGPTIYLSQQSSVDANQRLKVASNQSQTKTTPPLSYEKSENDPYAWVEEEEDDKPSLTPKPSEFAVREEDEEDDGIKPWFWPASRDVAKPSTTPHTRKLNAQDAPSPSLTNGISAVTRNKKEVATDRKELCTTGEKAKFPHERQERSSVQHALDDIQCIIDGICDTNSINSRCLSILTLANRCLAPATRDLLHAYGLLQQVCAHLHDAHIDYSLALTAAGLFFVFSRDRDPDLLTPETLVVLLKLLDAPKSMTEGVTPTEATTTSSKCCLGMASRQIRINKEASQLRSRVNQLLEAVAAQQQRRGRKSCDTSAKASLSNKAVGKGGLFVRTNPCSAPLNARHLRMNRQLTVRDMVIEAILNFSTRRAAPWFKAEIRINGGLDGVSDAAIDAVDYLKDLCIVDGPGGRSSFFISTAKNSTGLDDFSLDNLKRVGYYAKMLENMTYMNPDNQTHLVGYNNRALIDRLVQCIRLCASRLPRHPPPSTYWAELLRKGSEEKISGQQERIQPPTSSTEGVKAVVSTEVEFQQDQQTLLTCLLAIFRLFVNVSHNEFASDRLGGCPDLLEVTIDCLFHLPDCLPSSRRFDLLILILCLLANLCEHCPENRIRVVHLEVRSSESLADGNGRDVFNLESVSLDNVGYGDDEAEGDGGSGSSVEPPPVPMVSALDEVVKLFLYREKKTLMHEFEREEEGEGKDRKIGEADSTTTTVTSLQRPKPPPSLLADDDTETIEEAGLKWRLIGGNRHGNGKSGALGTNATSRCSKPSRRSRVRANRKRRRQALLRHGSVKRVRIDEDVSSEDDDEEDEEEEEEDDEMCSDEDDGTGGSEEEEEYMEDDESCGGADVEFVAETQEEQEQLKERMSSANQHMEDSVVAAYAALLLGCILQSSPRYAERIRSRLPEPGKFRPLAIMLAKLLSFLSLARGVETAGSESILRIVRILEAQDQPLQSCASTSPTISQTGLAPPVTRSAQRARYDS